MTSFETAAFLSMDFQLDILRDSALAPDDPSARARLDAAVEGAAKHLEVARSRGITVVHVRHAYRPGHVDGMAHMPMLQFTKKIGALVDGSPGATIDPRVAPQGDELVITKRAISAFAGTELDPLLRSRGIDTVILTGVVTHYVIEGTARHAADLGYRFIVLADACASADPARHENALKNLGPLGTVTTGAQLWGNA